MRDGSVLPKTRTDKLTIQLEWDRKAIDHCETGFLVWHTDGPRTQNRETEAGIDGEETKWSRNRHMHR